MKQYRILFKNGQQIIVVVEDEKAPAPVLATAAGAIVVRNLPDGYSVDAREVLAISPYNSGGKAIRAL